MYLLNLFMKYNCHGNESIVFKNIVNDNIKVSWTSNCSIIRSKIFGIKMAELLTKLKKLKPKISWKYLLFILFIIIGCSYQVIHVSKMYFEFETIVDVKYEKSEIVIPMISICEETIYLFRNSSEFKSIEGMSPAQVYNQTFNFNEMFIEIRFYSNDEKVEKLVTNFTDEDQNEIQYEKTISSYMTCYHFKYLNTKQLNNKELYTYSIYLYYHNESVSPYYHLFISSDMNYPNLRNDDHFKIFGIFLI